LQHQQQAKATTIVFARQTTTGSVLK